MHARLLHRVVVAFATLLFVGQSLASAADSPVGSQPASLTDEPFAFARTPGRLPKTVVPTDYILRLRPDLATKSFDGTVTVQLQLSEATSTLVLNALELNIRQARVEQAGASLPLAPTLDNATGLLRLAAPRRLSPGAATLTIDYAGRIGSAPQGLFASSYPTKTGTRELLSSEFEPAEARRMLPCWDEPAFRARFSLAIVLPAAFQAYSNMPVVSRTAVVDAPGLVETRFAPTPPMPVYLLTLAAGDLDRIADTQDGTEIGIVFPAGPGQRAAAAYALEASKKLLHFYNDYFGVSFPLPKLDQIALPNTSSGGMENWGAIVYRENALLFDPATASPERRRHVFYVVAHEMAHQWFGDLVTMAWWDDLWLNEGFAQWMEGKATVHFNPDWDSDLDVVAERDRAMALDARASTHPVQQSVASEADANAAFDDITYIKGQGFLNMLEDWLGPDAFRDGIRRYMRAHAYSNTTTADLWAALEVASGKPVAAFAGQWTRRPGFPEVRVSRTCAASPAEAGRLELGQQRFRADPETRTPDSLWPVPLTVTGIEPAGDSKLFLNGSTLTQAGVDCQSLLIVDPNAKDFVRLAYAPVEQARLMAAFPRLPASARLKLLQDTWARVAAGTLPLADYFDLLGALGSEPKQAVWVLVTDRLLELDRLLDDSPARAAFRQRARGVLAPKLALLGWDARPGEDDSTALLRANLVLTLGSLDDPAVVAEARRRYAHYLAAPDSLPPALADAVVGVVGRHADVATYDDLLRRARTTLVAAERDRYYNALNRVRDDRLAGRTLALALDPTVPEAKARNAVPGVAVEGDHRAQAWAFAKAHSDAWLARVPGRLRNYYMDLLLSTGASMALADDLEAFARTKLPADAKTEIERTAEAIRGRARLRDRLLPQLVGAAP